MDDVERGGQQFPISSSARQNGDSERRYTGKTRGNRQLSKVVGCQLRQKPSRRRPCDEGRCRQSERTVPRDEVHAIPQGRRGQAVGHEDSNSCRGCRSDRPQAGDQRRTGNHAHDKSNERVPGQHPGQAQSEDRVGVEAQQHIDGDAEPGLRLLPESSRQPEDHAWSLWLGATVGHIGAGGALGVSANVHVGPPSAVLTAPLNATNACHWVSMIASCDGGEGGGGGGSDDAPI